LSSGMERHNLRRVSWAGALAFGLTFWSVVVWLAW
jgi:hypothetical protein